MPFFVAHLVAQTVNTICFEGSAHVHLNGFGVALGRHLGLLFNNFAIKCPNSGITRSVQKVFAKWSQKRVTESYSELGA